MMRKETTKIFKSLALASLCVCFMLPAASAVATVVPLEEQSTVQIVEIVTENGESAVRYPQLDGMQNDAFQVAINDAIVREAKIAQRLITLSTLRQGVAGLQVTHTSFLKNELFSTVISAKGIMETLRSGHQYTALSYDLRTGQRLTLADVFTDPDQAVAWMEDQALRYADDLSTYLENAEVTPLPVESFAFDEYGITFYYPCSQFALLSGYSGAVQFHYGELQPFLIRDDNSVPDRLGILIPQYSDEQIKQNIETTVSKGTLPYMPVTLGDTIPDLIAEYRLVRTPDQYPGGRYYQLEAPVFRQTLILSDALTQGYDHSITEGILALRMNLYGIQTGTAQRSRWHEILGEPTVSVFLDASLSADYGLPPGTADYYTIENRQLMLYADEDDVLFAVRLTK